ncbi:MAG: hypothetical protein K6B28_04570, partial [Lachnospiraceae bacterium]|nr:hypothetical protein [Lachnospiraceae bacterium]
MKYYITVFLLSLGFLLSGYKQVAKSSDLTSPWSKSSDKTSKSNRSDKDEDEDEEDVHEDGDLTLREIKVINKALNSPKYYGFLLSEYDEPKYIDWNEVFYIGAGLSEVKRTASIEEAYLDETGNMEVIADLTILSADDIKDFVKKTTGLSYSKMRNPLDWVYL